MYFFRRTIYRNFTLNGNVIKVGGKDLERVRGLRRPVFMRILEVLLLFFPHCVTEPRRKKLLIVCTLPKQK